MLKGHGDDIYNFGREIVSNFSSNTYSRQDLSALQQHLCSHMNLIHSYPEPEAYSLTQLLGESFNISLENICVTNGATEAIYLIAQAFSGKDTSIIIPTFSEYEDACRIHNHKLSFYEKLEEINSQTQMVWICNPNNPTGKVYDIKYLENLVKQYKDILFVFDQSYGYFTSKPVWSIENAVQYKNVILLHSMTKQYAIPGLRLGYITAHADIIQSIEKYRMPWSVNGLAIEAGKFLIKNLPDTINIPDYLKETNRFREELKQIKDLKVYATDTHFFLCRSEKITAASLKLWLVENYGILIRDAANFRGLDKYYFRIATQSPDENNLLVEAIKASPTPPKEGL